MSLKTFVAVLIKRLHNYFSAHLKKNNVKILMVGMSYKAVPLPEMTSCAIGALHGNENHNGKNEKIVNKYFR